MTNLSLLKQACKTPAITDRYWSKVRRLEGVACWIWVGAITGRGHGRFWIGDGIAVIAHRFGWLLHAGDVDALPTVVQHACDNPLCQNPDHLRAGSFASNRQEYFARRGVPGSALNDVRGSAQRARAIRDTARDGGDIAAALAAGKSDLDRYQLPLW